MTIPEWIIRNLQDHGNSVVPYDLIRMHGEKEGVEAIQEKMGCLIEIRKVESTLSTAPLNNHSHRKLETVYIAEKVEKINRAINSLPNKCKLAFKLVKENQLKYKEVSEILNISIQPLDAHLTTAMKKIRENIND